jgi:hypothetical protein
MAFQVSPGVNFSEVDLTAGTQQVSVSDAAFAGPFNWGPGLEATNIGSEDDLVRIFGKPDDTIAAYWFAAQSFLAYSNLLHVVRALPTGAMNATAGSKERTGLVDSGHDGDTSNLHLWTSDPDGTPLNALAMFVGQKVLIDDSNNNVVFTISAVTDATHFATLEAATIAVVSGDLSTYGVQIPNQTAYEANWASGDADYGIVAKYPGELGNSLEVDVCTSANAYSNQPVGTLTVQAGNTTVVGSGGFANTSISVGDVLTLKTGQKVSVVSITNAVAFIISSAPSINSVSNTTQWTRGWKYAGLFDSAPGSSPYAVARNGAKDEMHIVVVDVNGVFSAGMAGTVLERFAFVSKGADSKDANGEANYYVDVLNNQSQYVWWLGTFATNAANWGASVVNTTFGGDVLPYSASLSGGQSASGQLQDADQEKAYDIFDNADQIDISLVITGPASTALASYIVQNICESRRDCVAFISPLKNDVVNNIGQEVNAVLATRNQLPSSSYAFLDSGWKYTTDKYNSKSRWVPLNGDIAGIAARSDSATDPWFSPAGFNRGNVKNVLKLAWNPKQLDRDELYKAGVNPVVSFPGQGTILYGDKTLLSRPSAFSHINVRRLFIIIEKTIARLGQASLFEFNDEFTRSQFRNAVDPYLRDVKSRRGVVDYRITCDTTNNTDAVINSNSFVGDIYVMPALSINYIQLNFVAVPSGVSFQEVTGSV